MKVIYREGFPGQCGDLVNGKAYDVIDTMECGEDGLFYLLIDESDDAITYGDASPYPAQLFDVVDENAAVPA